MYSKPKEVYCFRFNLYCHYIHRKSYISNENYINIFTFSFYARLHPITMFKRKKKIFFFMSTYIDIMSIVSIEFQAKKIISTFLFLCSSPFDLNGNMHVFIRKAMIFLLISIYTGFMYAVSNRFQRKNKQFHLFFLFLRSSSWNPNVPMRNKDILSHFDFY